jgi:hypothetical protein
MKMIQTLKTISFVFALGLFAFAKADEIKVQFDTDADRVVWVMTEMPETMPVGGIEFKVKEFVLNTPPNAKEAVILIEDVKTKNVAVQKVSNIPKNVWVVSEKDWRIGQVLVEVWREGKPVQTGTVELEVAGLSMTRLVSNGKAVFFAVPPGEASFIFRFLSSGVETITPAVKSTLSLTRSEEVPKFGITVTQPIDQMMSSSEKPEVKKDVVNENKSSQNNPILANALIWLMAVIAAGALLWFAWNYLRKQDVVLEKSLRSFGLPTGESDSTSEDSHDVSEKISLEPPPLVPEGHCVYCGQPLSSEGNCLCQLTSQEKQVAGVFMMAKSHQLVGSVTIDLGNGVSSIGREAGSVQSVISSPTVSRKHAEIRVDGNRVFIKDLGSRNGTFVNGRKIGSEEVELQGGDTVQFGSEKFRYEVTP